MNIIERINLFIESQKIRVSAFEKKSRLPNGYVVKIKNSPGISKIEDILKAYPQLNRSWLLTGEGDMLKSTSNTDTNSKEDAMTIEMLTRMLYDSNLKVKELERKNNELETENHELKYGSAKKESHVG